MHLRRGSCVRYSELDLIVIFGKFIFVYSSSGDLTWAALRLLQPLQRYSSAKFYFHNLLFMKVIYIMCNHKLISHLYHMQPRYLILNGIVWLWTFRLYTFIVVDGVLFDVSQNFTAWEIKHMQQTELLLSMAV